MTVPITVSRQGFAHPRYWPLWLGLGLLWCAVHLPYRWQVAVGAAMGWLMAKTLRRRRHIAAVNLQLSFPELSRAQRQRLLNRHFRSLGIGLLEIGLCWWGDSERLRRLVRAEGMEHLERAYADGRGVILLGAHYTTLELSGRLLTLSTRTPIRTTYRPHENPLLEHVITHSRNKHLSQTIPRDDMRAMIRCLRAGEVVWFATDQNFGHKHSVFAPFFGVPAATNTATARLARMTGAQVVSFASFRRNDGKGYILRLFPPLADFPSDSLEADATRLNLLIEEQVREHPDQYLWIHRRFKDRPPGQPDVYTKRSFA